jgi:hypothetical protein
MFASVRIAQSNRSSWLSEEAIPPLIPLHWVASGGEALGGDLRTGPFQGFKIYSSLPKT